MFLRVAEDFTDHAERVIVPIEARRLGQQYVVSVDEGESGNRHNMDASALEAS